MDIDQLPDAPALRQLADALWRNGPTRGAAVLVGAGFSRAAAIRPGNDTPLPPLWTDLARALRQQLYPEVAASDNPDPLRLAEEYRTNFGQASLDGVIRSMIRDAAWQHGPLHQALLELPWSDVLTTNWDTLLERAAASATPEYEPVRTMADIAHARAPRIVKLHGSIGATDSFIVAEEDYRTYPTRFAAFVNLARQVLLENELCLVGFSGDDPNFLQWSGWVRDILDARARRIFLVGALCLNPAKRKFLEARNIAPIDLMPAVEEHDASEPHAAAVRLFLAFLEKKKPKPSHEWTSLDPNQNGLRVQTMEDRRRRFVDPIYAAELLARAVRLWRQDRKSYPGWLVCPDDERTRMRHRTDAAPPLNDSNFAALMPEDGAAVLYELAWRHTTSFWPIDGGLASLMARVADPAVPCSLTQPQQLEVTAVLLRTAREAGDAAAFDRWKAILEARCGVGSDLRAEAAYQDCLWARDRLDFNAIQTKVEGVSGPDPMWRLRCAALLYECGEVNNARSLIAAARDDLRQRQRADRNSLWVQSRRAWAEWLGRAAQRDRFFSPDEDRWPVDFKAARCDPWDEIERIKDQAAQAVREARDERYRGLVPKFEAGDYDDPSATLRFRGGAWVAPAYELDRLADVVGLPLRMQHVSLFGDGAKDATEADFDGSEAAYMRLLRVVPDYDDPLLGRYLGRISVARLAGELAASLSGRVARASAYWRERTKLEPGARGGDVFAISRLRLFLETQARLTLRADPQGACANFTLATDIARDQAILHYWLFEYLGHLAQYSIEAIPPAQRKEVVLAALEFPLSNKPLCMPPRWPNPITALWGSKAERPANDLRWTQRIAQLVSEIASDGAARPDSILRLTYLATQKLLTEDERAAFGRALWARTDGGNPALPADTFLHPHVFAQLPAPPDIDNVAAARDRLYGAPNIGESVHEIAAAASGGQLHRVFAPTSDQAVAAFDALVQWRPTLPTDASQAVYALNRPRPHVIAWNLGVALAVAITPGVPKEARTEQRAASLLALTSDAPCPVAVGALPFFASLGGQFGTTIMGHIRRAVIGRTLADVFGGTVAINCWLQAQSTGDLPDLPRALVEQIIAAVETAREVGLQMLVECARCLLEANKLHAEDGERLDQALETLRVDAAYDNNRLDPEGEPAIALPLVRVECVRLAAALKAVNMAGPNARRWLADAPTDPLPEVRFALETRFRP